MYPVTKTWRYLRCVREIPACPVLEVGDLLWKVAQEADEGGYEYVICRRRGDGMVIRFRVEHLGDCFEVEEVEDGHLL